jgi:hypothetical protein
VIDAHRPASQLDARDAVRKVREAPPEYVARAGMHAGKCSAQLAAHIQQIHAAPDCITSERALKKSLITDASSICSQQHHSWVDR